MGLQNTLRALADPTRREILNLLKSGPLPAGELSARFDMSGAAVSKHLSVLKESGLIRDRREGRYIIYELNASVLEEVLLWLNDLRGGGYEAVLPDRADHHRAGPGWDSGEPEPSAGHCAGPL